MIEEVNNFLDKMNSSSSSNNKVEVIRNSSRLIRKILYYTYNNFMQYNVTSNLLEKRKDLCNNNTKFNSIFDLLDSLNQRLITGHKAIEETKASVLGGHLELDGFDMMRGVKATHGMETKPFKKFDMVLSGHYHTKSSRDNIHYLGTQLQLTFADANEKKYFHILDTETRELTPIENDDSMFHKLVYDETNKPDISEKLKNTYVKVVILNKKNLYEFDKWFDKLQRIEPFEIKVAESFEEYLGDNVEDEGISTADTTTLLNSYIDATETDLNKEVLKKLMHELYVEAQNMTDI